MRPPPDDLQTSATVKESPAPPVQGRATIRQSFWNKVVSLLQPEDEEETVAPSRANAPSIAPVEPPPGPWDAARRDGLEMRLAIERESLIVQLEAETHPSASVQKTATLAAGNVRLNFEGLPGIVDAVRSLDVALAGDSLSISRVEELIGDHAALSARVRATASSAAYGRKIDDLGVAISLLGLDRVARIARSLVLDLPPFRSGLLEAQALRTRRRAAVAADVCWMLAPQAARSDYHWAGLLHEMGSIVLLRCADVHAWTLGIHEAGLARLDAIYANSIATCFVDAQKLGGCVLDAVSAHPNATARSPHPARALRAARVAAHLALGCPPGHFELGLATIGATRATALPPLVVVAHARRIAGQVDIS